MPTKTVERPRTIPVCAPVLAGNERDYLIDAFDSGWVSSLGEYIPRFERAFADVCDARHGVACSSGTAALHLALEALQIGPGDEVIIPAFSLIVSANVVCLTGATPRLVDVDRETGCIDPQRVAENVNDRTRAIMAVHMYGHPADLDALCAIAHRHDLAVIEDGAQAHGASYRGRAVGGIGDLGCFSFYGNKILTTGEGGMVVTSDDGLAERVQLLRNQAFEQERFVHRHVGFNYRMTNLQAAIGLAQCERLHEKIARKRKIAAVYDELLAGVDGVETPVEREGCRSVYWMYGVRIEESFGRRKNDVIAEMSERGVETRSFFVPLNVQPVYDGWHRRWPDLTGSFPVSEELGERGLYLPSGEGLTREDQEYVVEQLLACRR